MTKPKRKETPEERIARLEARVLGLEGDDKVLRELLAKMKEVAVEIRKWRPQKA